MKITQADPETVIKTLLTNNWNTTNTDSKKPTFDISSEESVSKRQNFNNIDSEILIYERNRQNLHTSTGSAVKREAYHVALDSGMVVKVTHTNAARHDATALTWGDRVHVWWCGSDVVVLTQ